MSNSMLRHDQAIVLSTSNIMTLLGSLTGTDNPGRAKTKDAAAKRFAVAAQNVGIDFMPILGAPDFSTASAVLGAAMTANKAKSSTSSAVAVAAAKAAKRNAVIVKANPAPVVREAGSYEAKATAPAASGKPMSKKGIVVSFPSGTVKAPVLPKSTNPATGKRAAAVEAAARGELPVAPDFTANTHKPYRAKLAALVAMVEAGDVAGLKAVTINPTSTSPRALAKYRDLAVIALTAKTNAKAG